LLMLLLVLLIFAVFPKVFSFQYSVFRALGNIFTQVLTEY